MNTAEIDLINTGKVEFDFLAMDVIEGDGENIKPRQLDVFPFKVWISPQIAQSDNTTILQKKNLLNQIHKKPVYKKLELRPKETRKLVSGDLTNFQI